MYDRRHVLRGAAAMGLGTMFMGGVAWSRPNAPVRAILPSATHDTLGVKVLLDTPPSSAPVLKINGRAVAARKMDADGYSWGFVQSGLSSGKPHELTLADERGKALRAPWQLKTLPPPDSAPDHFRVLFFTCAGGDEAGGADGYLPVAVRRALFDRALSFSPDLAVANGDHVYWDLDTALKYRRDPVRRAQTEELYRKIAWIDQDLAFDSETNRRSVNTVAARQIASIYEDRFASVPLIFITDDHDYYENDNAGPWGYSLPPRPFIFGLQQQTQALAYPIALGRPDWGNTYEAGTVETLKIGKLLDLAFFDCRRGWSTGPNAGVLFPKAEEFLLNHIRTSTAQQYFHVPSNPFGWTAGKLGEWYADGPSESSAFHNDKGYWQQGWFEQHQRLAAALGAQRGRAGISISGDMHASAISKISRSGDIDLSANPIHTILPGTIGTAKQGFPSEVRGIFPWHPAALESEDVAKIEERNGFSIIDVYPDRVTVKQFRWRPPEPVAAIASLEPYTSYTIVRPA